MYLREERSFNIKGHLSHASADSLPTVQVCLVFSFLYCFVSCVRCMCVYCVCVYVSQCVRVCMFFISVFQRPVENRKSHHIKALGVVQI